MSSFTLFCTLLIHLDITHTWAFLKHIILHRNEQIWCRFSVSIFHIYCTNIKEENCKIKITRKVKIHEIHTIQARVTIYDLFLRKKKIDRQSLKLRLCKSVFEIFSLIWKYLNTGCKCLEMFIYNRLWSVSYLMGFWKTTRISVARTVSSFESYQHDLLIWNYTTITDFQELQFFLKNK